MEGARASSAIVPSAGEAEVIERARSGDRAGFEILIAPRIDPLFRTAWAIVGNEADAADATQEACLSAWKHLPRLRDVDSFDAWLGRILVNSCRSQLRRRHRVREIAIPDGFEGEAGAAVAPDSVDDVELVSRAFSRLDPDARSLLVLHHLRHETVPRISSVLGIPEGTVKFRLHAARKALARALEGERR